MTEKREIKINGLTEAELYFVSEFAHKTEDAGLIDKLISEFEEENHDTEAIIRKYSTIAGMKPKWIDNIENLLVALEMYRKQEEIVINRLTEALKAVGITVSEEQLKGDELNRVKEEVDKNIKSLSAGQISQIR